MTFPRIVIPLYPFVAVRPRRQPRRIYLFRGRRRHRQTAARHQYINSVKSALGCCRFVTDEVRRPIRYSFAGWRPIQGDWLSSYAPGPQLMPKLFSDPEAIAEDIIRDVGTNLVVGLPLGLGKANHVVNALYARASADRSIKLTLFSALTLEKPRPSSLLERRFIGPVIDRLFGGYPDLTYANALHAGELPPNIEVIEFFFLAGKWLHVPFAQQHYISANYTHAASYLLARGCALAAA